MGDFPDLVVREDTPVREAARLSFLSSDGDLPFRLMEFITKDSKAHDVAYRVQLMRVENFPKGKNQGEGLIMEGGAEINFDMNLAKEGFQCKDASGLEFNLEPRESAFGYDMKFGKGYISKAVFHLPGCPSQFIVEEEEKVDEGLWQRMNDAEIPEEKQEEVEVSDEKVKEAEVSEEKSEEPEAADEQPEEPVAEVEAEAVAEVEAEAQVPEESNEAEISEEQPQEEVGEPAEPKEEAAQVVNSEEKSVSASPIPHPSMHWRDVQPQQPLVGEPGEAGEGEPEPVEQQPEPEQPQEGEEGEGELPHGEGEQLQIPQEGEQGEQGEPSPIESRLQSVDVIGEGERGEGEMSPEPVEVNST